MVLSAEELLAGTEAVHEVPLPADLLSSGVAGSVKIRPLSIGTFQLIMKAAKEDAGLIPLLMIKECLVEPPLDLPQARRLPVGVVEFLVTHIRTMSGLVEKKTF